MRDRYREDDEKILEDGINLSQNPFGKRIDVVERRQLELKMCEDRAKQGILSIPDYIGDLKELVRIGIDAGYVNRDGFLANALPYSQEVGGGLSPSKPFY